MKALMQFKVLMKLETKSTLYLDGDYRRVIQSKKDEGFMVNDELSAHD